MGSIYIDTGGSADNSGTTDVNTADLSGTAATRVSANLIQLDAATDLSGVVTTAGPTQSAINIAGATNANTTIFWITAVNDGLDQVTVTPDPTGMTTNAWKIGGRHLLTSARVEAALRAGDTAIFNNSPAAANAILWTFRIAGNSTLGMAKVMGKAGVRPVLNATGTTGVISSAFFNTAIENLELDQDGASGNVVTSSATFVAYNIKISDGGGSGFVHGTAGTINVLASEISGLGADGINNTINYTNIFGCYVHDNGADGVELGAALTAFSVAFNIIDTNAGRGIFLSGAATAGSTLTQSIQNNTIYGNGNSGLEATDADQSVQLYNNIFQDNGNAAGEYNVEWVAGFVESVGTHGYNTFYHAGGGGGANLFGLTANATESTADPLFTNPAAGDFSLGTTSPAKATAFPGQFLGGNLGYLDMGAVQRQEAGAGGSGIVKMAGDGGGFAG